MDNIISCIFSYLSSYDKYNFIMTNKNHYKFENKIQISNKIKRYIIKNSKFYNQFTNIITDEIITFPKSIKELIFMDNFNYSIENCISYSVTHLTFRDHFNQLCRI